MSTLPSIYTHYTLENMDFVLLQKTSKHYLASGYLSNYYEINKCYCCKINGLTDELLLRYNDPDIILLRFVKLLKRY